MDTKKILIFGVLISIILFSGCTTTDNNQTPRLTITQPQNGAILQTNNITVAIQVANFDIVNKIGQTNIPGEGHIHYFLDVPPPTTPNQPAITEPGTYISTTEKSYTWINLTTGVHNLSVELVNNDHTPLVPAIIASVTITILNSSEPGQNVVVYLKAQNLVFNLSTITVPAGANVFVHFINYDNGIAHNFAVYTNSAATNQIFVGDIILGDSSGSAIKTYTFTAPLTPGIYYFRCDVHPNTMNGDFVVQ